MRKMLLFAIVLIIGTAWGQDCTADDGTEGVELWGQCYSIENTTELNLSYSELTGNIPPEIGNLTNLMGLYLGGNQLTGEIPSEIGDLTNLTILILFGNQLTGEIPPEIGNLTNLNHWSLSSNQLTGSIPSEIGNLTNLTYLTLGDNQLTGEIPSEIWNMTNLLGLYLGYNQLTGSIPTEIGNLTNLTYMDLHYNQLTGSIPSEIGNLTNLEWLTLNDNQLTGEIPETICNLSIDWGGDYYGFLLFDISNNQLCPPYPSCIIDYVGEQDTSNCVECDENSEVELWGQNYSVENTTIIDLNNSGLAGLIPPEIGCLSNLTTLLLQNNELSGEIPETICDLNMDWTSSNFKIYNNQLCPPYPSCIEDYVGEQDTTNCNQVSIFDETFPITYKLYNAYPNPFNPVTTLQYELPLESFVNITVYDMLGNVVNNLINTNQSSGYKSVKWNATNNQGQPVSAGVYLYSIEAGDFRQTKKMILLK